MFYFQVFGCFACCQPFVCHNSFPQLFARPWIESIRMKRYVLGYRHAKQDRPPIEAPSLPRLIEPVENFEVGYSEEPILKLETLAEAEVELAFLRRIQVHVGSHYCEFEIEQLADDGFAIVCVTHPDHLKMSWISETLKGE